MKSIYIIGDTRHNLKAFKSLNSLKQYYLNNRKLSDQINFVKEIKELKKTRDKDNNFDTYIKMHFNIGLSQEVRISKIELI